VALRTCEIHQLTYNDKLDPTCPQCTLAGIHIPDSQVPAEPGVAGAPREET